MKYSFNIIFTFILVLTVNVQISAQDLNKEFDTLKVKSLEGDKIKFTLNDSLLKKVTISKSHPKHAKIKGKHVFGDLGRGMLTLVSGIGTEDSKDNIDIQFINRIKCRDSRFDWEIKIYCKGTIENELNRNRNDDGGVSLSVDHYAYIDWSQGVWGEIMKENKKIGEFILVRNLNSKNISFTGPLMFLNDLNNDFIKKNKSENEKLQGLNINNYSIIGELYGQKFKVIKDFELQRDMIYQDKTLKTILQASEYEKYSAKKVYFLLKDPDISTWELTYWAKLSLFFEYLNLTLQVDNYNW